MSARRDTLLFDLDGTLTDTDALHFEAYRTLLGPLGVAITHDVYRSRIMGATNAAIMAWLFPEQPPARHAALSAEKERLFRGLAGAMRPLPGLVDLLDWAESLAVRTAVVTNAPRENAEMMLDALGLAARFPVLVIADELPRGKPDPLPYRTALERLGRPPGAAFAFEDSRSGVAAAHAAGVTTFGVTTGLDAATLTAVGACAAITDFRDPVLLAALRREFGSAPAG